MRQATQITANQIIIILIVPILLLCLKVNAQEHPTGDPSIILPDSKLEKVFDKGFFTEGPAMAFDGTVYFVDMGGPHNGDRIWRYDPRTGNSSIYRSGSETSLGIEFDAEGRMVVTAAGVFGCRCLSRTDLTTGNSVVLAGLYEGRPFNGPNDLTIDEQGRIYFTDYGYIGQHEVYHQNVYGVYRLTGDSVHRVIDHPGRPNGIVISPDQKTLYVSYAHSDIYRKGIITAYNVLSDGKVELRSIIVAFEAGIYGGDGMTVDKEGNLYVALPTRDKTATNLGVRVYSPSGKEIAFIPVEGGATNLAFGRGEQSHYLYVTSGRNMYRIRVGKVGYHLPQKK